MLKNVTENIRLAAPLTKFTLSGDPGCDGYNVEAICITERIMSTRADLHLILGDLVPTGRDRWYRQFERLIDSAASAPVYCLPGNHDLPDYSRHFGRASYFIKTPNALIIVLDNARRYFTPEAMELLREALKEDGVTNIFVAFHIPPPNQFIPNHISQEEWEKVRDLLLPHRERVRAIFSGHVHSAFEFDLDGFHVVVSGGAGARLDKVKNTFFGSNQFHYFEAGFKDGAWKITAIPVHLDEVGIDFSNVDGGPEILAKLNENFAGECQAHRRYALFAEEAREEGYPGIAKLFAAAADAEWRHSRNMLLASGTIKKTVANLEDSLRRERHEWEDEYPARIREGEGLRTRRVVNAYQNALTAEKVHYALFQTALEALQNGKDIPVGRYFTCTRCGYTHAGDSAPTLCPACGTDNFRFVEVE